MRGLRASVLALAFAVACPASAGWFDPIPVHVDYAPGSALIVHGSIRIGNFVHLPSSTKPEEANRWTGLYKLSSLTIDRPVAEFFRESLLKELRGVGMTIDGQGPILSGEIRGARAHPDNSDLTDFAVHYVVKDEQGTVLYDAEKVTTQYVGAGNISAPDATLTANFEALIRDERFLEAINPGIHPKIDTALAVFDGRPQNDVAFTHIPSTGFLADGAVQIGAFEYLPPTKGKVRPDQINNKAPFGYIELSEPAATFFARALLKEIRLAGTAVESRDRILTGQIVEWFCNDLGQSADWLLDVKYTVKDGSGAVLYQGEIVTKETTSKWFEAISKIIRHNAEHLLSDEAFLKAIGATTGLNPPATVAAPYDNDTTLVVYSPMTALSLKGSVEVGAFTYPPSENGKLKPNQMANTALMRNNYLDEPVAVFMRNATLNELRIAGVNVHKSSRVLTAEVKEFSVRDTSDPTEWTIAIRFLVKDSSGAVLYDAIKTTHPTGPQFPSQWKFDEVKANIEALMTDPAFAKAINS